MPNHIHGILIFGELGVCNTPLHPAAAAICPIRPFRSPSRSLGSIVRGFKAATTSRARQSGLPLHQSLWQRNYYERILRNDRELNQVRQYICDNPRNWAFDPEPPHPIPNPKYDKLWSWLHPRRGV